LKTRENARRGPRLEIQSLTAKDAKEKQEQELNRQDANRNKNDGIYGIPVRHRYLVTVPPLLPEEGSMRSSGGGGRLSLRHRFSLIPHPSSLIPLPSRSHGSFCLLSSAFCLLSSAFCLLSSAFCPSCRYILFAPGDGGHSPTQTPGSVCWYPPLQRPIGKEE
jgi:hypothetical protein